MTRYPIFVISKGRWETMHTANALREMNASFRVVVEPKELPEYAKGLSEENILPAPEDFSERGRGSIPVRNWVWENSLKQGDSRHWLLDDNIRGFERLNKNTRGKVYTDAIFRAAEDFVDRFENVALAGFEYRQFSGGARRYKPPFKVNRRIYSCSLINNALDLRWRGKFNEDTDLCLRAMKEGWATISFNCFLQNKIATMTMRGGNTDTIYNQGDERLEFARSLAKQHPDCVWVVRKFGRWHHEVDYSKFKHNALGLKQEYLSRIGENSINNYNMKEVT